MMMRTAIGLRIAKITSVLFSALLLTAASAYGAEVRVTADKMKYDPSAGIITVEGNVSLKREDGSLTGDKGYGAVDGSVFTLEGNVQGAFPSKNASISCGVLKLTTNKKTEQRHIIASGNVKLTRGTDTLRGSSMSWELETDNYKAKGNVAGSFLSHSIDADEITRTGDTFWLKGVRRYEDRARKLFFRADNLQGKIVKETVTELEAVGNVKMEMPAADGKIITVTGDKSIFSEARGTVVVSGSAKAIQEKRGISAKSLVMHLESRRVEAIGESTITFETEE